MKRITTKRKFNWDEFFHDKGSTWRDKDYRFLTSHFDPDIFKGELADVGCGLADGLIYLKNVCKNTTKFIGLDHSPTALESNMHFNPDMEFRLFNLDTPLNKQFDNIICLQTLEHIDNPVQALVNLINATRKTLIISTPYKNKRPDIDHMWSFDENDFKEFMDSYIIGENGANIYWRLDKS